jgi:hypothetical protein
MVDAAIPGLASPQKLPTHGLERAANGVPPSADSGVAPKCGSLGLGNQRSELDILGRQRQDRVQMPELIALNAASATARGSSFPSDIAYSRSPTASSA